MSSPAALRRVPAPTPAGRGSLARPRSVVPIQSRKLSVTPRAAAKVESPALSNEVKYMVNRINTVQEHFPTAVSMDDFLFKLEMALCAYGFTGENSIAVANMCRDEITCGLKYKIEKAYPLVFNINGLGGGITCGVTGIGAGLSHSPKSVAGKARYVFFSFPHIAITSKGVLGTVGRPGQDQPNFACGALIAALGQLKAEGLEDNLVAEGVHTPKDPEYSILKQRIARRMVQEEVDPKDMDLVGITKVAERQISSDLEFLISKAVNPEVADYAIITGVQIHNWSDKFDDDEPNLEFVAPSKVSVVIDGERTDLDLSQMPAGTPRQLRKLADKESLDSTRDVAVYTGTSTVTDVTGSPMFSNNKEIMVKQERDATFAELIQKTGAKSFGVKSAVPPSDDPVL